MSDLTPEEIAAITQPVNEHMTAEFQNVHHRLNEIKALAEATNGRVDKLELRAAYEDGQDATQQAMRGETYRIVGAMAAIAGVAIGVVTLIQNY